jgi:hypothetical protein
MVYNYSVYTTIKHLSALAEEINSNLEVILTWAIGIGITLYFKDQGINEYESLSYKVILIQIAGFILIVLGGLLYNGLVIFIRDPNHKENNILENF